MTADHIAHRDTEPLPDLRRSCVVVDDHQAILAFLESYLERHEFTVPALAQTGKEGIAALERHRPDIAIVDLKLPDMSGIDVTAAAVELGTRVLIYSGTAEPKDVSAALAAGAGGILLKDAPVSDLRVALAQVAGRRPYVDAVLAGALRQQEAAALHLTNREQQVLGALAEGASYATCARQLGIGEATIRTHARHAIAALGARNRNQAVATALRRSLIA